MSFLEVFQIGATVLVSLGGGAIIVFALSSWLGKVWANRIMQKDLVEHTKQLDALRHQFQLEQKQMSVIFESQKSSFTNVIKAMHAAIKALEQPWDDNWEPLSAKQYERFEMVIVTESLIVGAEGEWALELFSSVLAGTVMWWPDAIPDDRILRQSYDQLSFLFKNITEYFRVRVGLPGHHSRPLDEINLLGACLLLNEYYRDDKGFASSVLILKKDQNTNQLVSQAKANLSLLQKYLEAMVGKIESDAEIREWRFEQASRAKYYLEVLGSSGEAKQK
ncbi:MAG: hypothetical protein KA801_04660 [Syntrophorhabdaceae bacterium]|nr:hypothetical protein [Syntrophorhabdaceae bacterium]